MSPGKHLGEERFTAHGQRFVWTHAGWLWTP
jgi:hypothetical protein